LRLALPMAQACLTVLSVQVGSFHTAKSASGYFHRYFIKSSIVKHDCQELRHMMLNTK